MTRRGQLLSGLLLAVVLMVAVPSIRAAASTINPYPNDAYFTAHFYGYTAPANEYAYWAPDGDTYVALSGGMTQFTPTTGTCSQNSTHTFIGSGITGNSGTDTWTAPAAASSGYTHCQASTIWPCCDNGAPTIHEAGPFATTNPLTFNAINVNGGSVVTAPLGASTNGSSPTSATACSGITCASWTWCSWFTVADNQGAILFTTAISSTGRVATDGLVLSVGTIGNLVLWQNTVGAPAVSEVFATNNTWDYACVSYVAATKVATLTGYNSTTQHSITLPTAISTTSWGNSQGTITQAGDIELYGTSWLGDALSSTNAGPGNAFNGSGSTAWTPPTNPAANGGGTIGSPAGTGGCTTSGVVPAIISGAMKYQWCAPNFFCSAIDFSWTNLLAGFSWLGCVLSQGLATLASVVVNAAIDLVVPDMTLIQTQWNTTYTNLQTSVPTNYAVGALSTIPAAFAGAHSAAALSFDLPAPWSTHITLNWSDYLGGLTPYRGLLAGLVYLGFAASVVTAGRRTFEH